MTASRRFPMKPLESFRWSCFGAFSMAPGSALFWKFLLSVEMRPLKIAQNGRFCAKNTRFLIKNTLKSRLHPPSCIGDTERERWSQGSYAVGLSQY